MDRQRGWVADTSIGWRILLTAKPAEGVPVPADLDLRLSALYAAHGWPAPPALVAGGSLTHLQRALVAAAGPVALGSTAGAVVISAHHRAVDGLGLLEILDRCGLGPATSAARGVGDAPSGTLATGVPDRLAEALLRPPLRPRPPARTGADGDTLVTGAVDGPRRTADLVHAATQAVVEWQQRHRAPTAHVAIAVGASRGTRAPGELLTDGSVLLRLRDVEQLGPDAIAAALRSARPQPSPHDAAGSRLAGAVLGAGLRVLRPRLGSTLLVSHLGEVTAPRVERLAFHPVTAGGSGLALGAVGHRGRTTVTLRGRASRWDDDGLEQLLEAIIRRL